MNGVRQDSIASRRSRPGGSPSDIGKALERANTTVTQFGPLLSWKGAIMQFVALYEVQGPAGQTFALLPQVYVVFRTRVTNAPVSP
jgi:hypothetical protein